ncbi:hypothetical protein ASC80_07395 [Afipia sp. Root123D2]|uniref:head-tail connector protein n=1 Tax=Afipia sp. Root123D2 TaxID=1736436 RepID=UPI0006F5F075|nr:head-tail connector protein [Afipia sp. Root123D2]KQW23121.1 hypothetical protein ASC80_07395 [Afipia sp. Root123D2]
MSAVTLDDVKAHIRISHSSEDSYLESLLDAAEGYVASIGVVDESPPQPAIGHAILLLVGHWYQNRESAATEPPKAIAFGVDTLLAPYREVNL